MPLNPEAIAFALFFLGAMSIGIGAVYLPTMKEIWEKLHVFRVKKGKLDTQDLYQDDHFAVAPFVVPIVSMDSNGKPYPLFSTGGILPVTEASGAAIASDIYTLRTLQATTNGALSIAAGLGIGNEWHHRLGRNYSQMSAGGDKVYAALHAHTDGYYGVVHITGIMCTTTTPAGQGILTFESPGATPALPSVCAMPALPANTFVPLDIIVTNATLTDAADIGVIWTDFGTPNDCYVYLAYEHWDET
jgi:hypothetical protein